MTTRPSYLFTALILACSCTSAPLHGESTPAGEAWKSAWTVAVENGAGQSDVAFDEARRAIALTAGGEGGHAQATRTAPVVTWQPGEAISIGGYVGGINHDAFHGTNLQIMLQSVDEPKVRLVLQIVRTAEKVWSKTRGPLFVVRAVAFLPDGQGKVVSHDLLGEPFKLPRSSGLNARIYLTADASGVRIFREGEVLTRSQKAVDLSSLAKGARLSVKLINKVKAKPGNRTAHLDDLIARPGLPPSPADDAIAADPAATFSTGQDILEHFDVYYEDGAQGEVVVDPARHSGPSGGSLKIRKTNGRGYIHLVSKQPMKMTLPPGKDREVYRFIGQYQTENAPITSLLLFRVASKFSSGPYDAIDKGWGFGGQSMVANKAPGLWDTRIVSHAIARRDEPKDQPAYRYPHLHILLSGNPATVWVDDLEFTSRKDPAPKSLGGNDFSFGQHSDEDMQKILAARSDATARVTRQDGRVCFEVDGQARPPIFYKANIFYPRTPNPKDYPIYPAGKSHTQDFIQADVPIFNARIELGRWYFDPGLWSIDEQGQPVLDTAALDRIILDHLSRAPQGYLLPELCITAPDGWGRRFPEELWRTQKGEYLYFSGCRRAGAVASLDDIDNVPPIMRPWGGEIPAWLAPSYHSTLYREQVCDVLRLMIRHMRTQPYWKAIVGFQVSGGHDIQWQISKPGPTRGQDYSRPAREGFRRWLKEHYGSVVELNRQWGSEWKSFDEVALPKIRQPATGQPPREAHGPYHRADRPALADYALFRYDDTFALREQFAEVLKAEAGKDIVVSAYGMPMGFMLSHGPMLKHVDFLGGQFSFYPYREPGLPSGTRFSRSFGLHGKIPVQEIDLRSFAGHQKPSAIWRKWIGQGDTPAEWAAMHRKMIGPAMAVRAGWWYWEMANEYNHPAIMEEIGKVSAVARKVFAYRGPIFRPDVIVLQSRRGWAENSPSINSVTWALGEKFQTAFLETSGVPYAVYDLDDVLARPELQDRKVYVFHNVSSLTASQREQINTKLKSNGRTLVFVHDTGYLTETGPSVEAMSELVGMKVDTDPRYGRMTAQVLPQADPLTRGVLPFQGGSELYCSIIARTGPAFFMGRYQSFRINDPQATVLARYVEDDTAAMAVRRFEGWTSIVLGAPNSLGPNLLNNIAAQANAFRVADPGNEIHLNNAFLSIHALRNGPATITLPRQAAVRDAFSGELLAEDARTVTVKLTAGQTRWLLLDAPQAEGNPQP